MSRLRIACFSVSIDGFGAGPDQSLENPLGAGGHAVHEWAHKTEAFQKMLGGMAGSTGVDHHFVVRGFTNIGAWILGRNMFGPVRGPWPDERWQGWWGDNPPYHTEVFVLTHYPRASISMAGGTTFHFVTEGIRVALDRANEAAGGLDVRVGGGAQTIRQYLQARLVDEMHIAIVPVLLGTGESPFHGLDLVALGYQCTEHVATEDATHVILSRV